MSPVDTCEDTLGEPEVDIEELAGLLRDEERMKRMAEDVSRRSMLAYYASFLLGEERTGYLSPGVERMLDEELASGNVTREQLQRALDDLRAGASVSAPHNQARSVALWKIRKRA